MKKIVMFAFVAALAYTNANAGIWRNQTLGVDQHGTPQQKSACAVTRVNRTTTQTLVDDEAVALYWVVLSTGASGDYAILRDTGSVTNSGASSLTAMELFYSSTGANTQFTFDPPVGLANGLTITGSAANSVVVCTRAKDSD